MLEVEEIKELLDYAPVRCKMDGNKIIMQDGELEAEITLKNDKVLFTCNGKTITTTPEQFKATLIKTILEWELSRLFNTP